MLTFFISAIAISLSGVLAPGPITAATLAAGARQRHAGAMIALGHAVVEFPLILLLVVGVARYLESPVVGGCIGAAGGVVLVLMGMQLLLSLRRESHLLATGSPTHPFVLGVVLTAANPYFLVWWATVGLALASQAVGFGAVALVAFAVVHWLCDLVWLEVLSQAGYRGSKLLGPRAQTVVSAICGAVLLGFGIKFLYDAGVALV